MTDLVVLETWDCEGVGTLSWGCSVSRLESRLSLTRLWRTVDFFLPPGWELLGFALLFLPALKETLKLEMLTLLNRLGESVDSAVSSSSRLVIISKTLFTVSESYNIKWYKRIMKAADYHLNLHLSEFVWFLSDWDHRGLSAPLVSSCLPPWSPGESSCVAGQGAGPGGSSPCWSYWTGDPRGRFCCSPLYSPPQYQARPSAAWVGSLSPEKSSRTRSSWPSKSDQIDLMIHL